MRREVLTIVTCFCTLFTYGQKGLSADQGAYSSSIGGISSVVPSSAAVLNNFSRITDQKTFGALVTTSRRFNLQELSSVSIGFHLPASNIGHFGVELYNYGFESFSEQQLSLKYARKLRSNLSISGSLGMHRLQVEGNGSAQKVIVGIGLSGLISDDLIWGFHLSNPEKQSFNEDTDLVTRLIFGLNYLVSKKVRLYGEVEKQLEENLSIKTGINYTLHANFNIRVGYNTLPGQMSMGFSWLVRPDLGLETAFSYNNLLGVTPTLTLKYKKSQKNI